MNDKIVHHASLFEAQVVALKTNAPLYPKVYFEFKDGHHWITSIVEFEYNNVIYKRHHVESIIPTPTVGINNLYNKLVDAAELTIKSGIPCVFDEIVGLAKPKTNDEIKT